MAIFTREFASADEYEEWLREVGERIHVLGITNHPGPKNLSQQSQSVPVVVKYQTSERSLAPAQSTAKTIAQVAIIGVVFFILFLYLISKLS